MTSPGTSSNWRVFRIDGCGASVALDVLLPKDDAEFAARRLTDYFAMPATVRLYGRRTYEAHEAGWVPSSAR
jgi:hypothetical protein